MFLSKKDTLKISQITIFAFLYARLVKEGIKIDREFLSIRQ